MATSGTTIADILVGVGLDVAPLAQGRQDAEREFTRFGSGIENIAKRIGTSLSVVAKTDLPELASGARQAGQAIASGLERPVESAGADVEALTKEIEALKARLKDLENQAPQAGRRGAEGFNLFARSSLEVRKGLEDLADVMSGGMLVSLRQVNAALVVTRRAFDEAVSPEDRKRFADMTVQLEGMRDQMMRVGGSAGGATSAVMAFGGIISDLPYGIRGVANNIEFAAQSFTYLTKTSGGVRPALAAMAGALTGPAGIVSVIWIASTAFTVFGDKIAEAFSKGKKKAEEAIPAFRQALDALLQFDAWIDGVKFTPETIGGAIDATSEALGGLRVNLQDVTRALEDYDRIQSDLRGSSGERAQGGVASVTPAELERAKQRVLLFGQTVEAARRYQATLQTEVAQEEARLKKLEEQRDVFDQQRENQRIMLQRGGELVQNQERQTKAVKSVAQAQEEYAKLVERVNSGLKLGTLNQLEAVRERVKGLKEILDDLAQNGVDINDAGVQRFSAELRNAISLLAVLEEKGAPPAPDVPEPIAPKDVWDALGLRRPRATDRDPLMRFRRPAKDMGAEETVDAFDKLIGQLNTLRGFRELGISTPLEDAQQRAQALQQGIKALLDEGFTPASETVQYFAEQLKIAKEEADASFGGAAMLAAGLGEAVGGVVSQLILAEGKLESFGQVAKRILAQVAAQFAAAAAKAALLSIFFPGATQAAGGFGALFKGFLGFRAAGGPVDARGAYVVGERGPELFVPRTSGTVVPNRALAGRTVVDVRVQPIPPAVLPSGDLVFAYHAAATVRNA